MQLASLVAAYSRVVPLGLSRALMPSKRRGQSPRRLRIKGRRGRPGVAGLRRRRRPRALAGVGRRALRGRTARPRHPLRGSTGRPRSGAGPQRLGNAIGTDQGIVRGTLGRYRVALPRSQGAATPARRTTKMSALPTTLSWTSPAKRKCKARPSHPARLGRRRVRPGGG